MLEINYEGMGSQTTFDHYCQLKKGSGWRAVNILYKIHIKDTQNHFGILPSLQQVTTAVKATHPQVTSKPMLGLSYLVFFFWFFLTLTLK